MSLNVRISDELKTESAQVLAEYGLTLSDAVRIFLTSVVKKNGLPAELIMDEATYGDWLEARLQDSLKDRGVSRPARSVIEAL